jgi:hypothetical protein
MATNASGKDSMQKAVKIVAAANRLETARIMESGMKSPLATNFVELL